MAPIEDVETWLDEKTKNAMMEMALTTLENLVYDPTEGAESPIEKLFIKALWASAVLPGIMEIREQSTLLMYGDDAALEHLIIASLENDGKMAGAAQVPIGVYRADFVITCQRNIHAPPIVLVIECDGHDFHEKTKEQARRDKARDRFMVSEGYHVMRFAGSEIWADPGKCAVEALHRIWQIQDHEWTVMQSGMAPIPF